MDQPDLLKRLIENALDFLRRSIDDLERSPKYSVIHFYSAVELLVKARLMAEHWTLIVSKRQEPDLAAFAKGDFESVTLRDAAGRLQKIVGSGLTDAELNAFLEVARHRNKMVHFFHEADTAVEGRKVRQSIAMEQLNAWYLLHRVLTGRWRETFLPWLESFNEIERALRKYHTFLQVVFDNLKSEIKQLKSSGFEFRECPSCRFEAQQHAGQVEQPYVAPCLVCRLSQTVVIIGCPECDEHVYFANEGHAECTACGKLLEPDDVADALIDDGAAHVAAMEGDDSWDAGNCSDCGGHQTVVRCRDDTYLCMWCFGTFESMGACDWCNELNTGDMEESYLAGCGQCGGRFGWEKDD